MTRKSIGLVLLGCVSFLGVGTWKWLADRPFAYAESQALAPPSASAVGAPPLDGWKAVPLELVPQVEGRAPAQPPRAVSTQKGPVVESFKNTKNYLLVGVDHTRGRLWGRADTLMIASFDDVSHHVGVVSIPRDLFVAVPGHGAARINATLRIGTQLDVDPLKLLSRVVQDTLGVPIQHTVVGNLEAFERVVDSVGGVDIDARCPIQDNFLDDRMETGRRVLDLKAGPQHLSGTAAAMYIRSRHGRSDWDRARRQQAVLLGLRDAFRELSALEMVQVLSAAMEEGVTSSMSRFEMLQLGRRLTRLSPRKIHGMLLGSKQVTLHRTTDGRAVLLPNPEAIAEALSKLFEAPPPGVPKRGAGGRVRPCPAADVALKPPGSRR